MFVTDLLSWWYGAGFKDLSRKFKSLFVSTSDFFSVDILGKTLFQPFRQTLTTSNYKRTLGEKIGDAVVSRSMGFLVRSFLILIGLTLLCLEALLMGLLYVIWPIVPFVPFLLIALSAMEVGF